MIELDYLSLSMIGTLAWLGGMIMAFMMIRASERALEDDDNGECTDRDHR